MSSAAYEMSDDDKRAVVAEFLSESEGHLEKLNQLLLKAEELIKAGQEVPTDEINTMFRAAHTVKGSASMLGFDNLSHLTHEMETILDRVRNKKMVLTSAIIEVLFNAFDSLNGLLDQLRNEGNDNGNVTEVIEKIKQILAGGDAGAAPAAAASAAPAPAEAAPAAAPAAAQPAPQPQAPAEPVPAHVGQSLSPEISKFLPAFLEDSEGCILRFNEVIMAIEKDDFHPDQLNELFRLAHTLKGSSGVIKCKGIESVAHKMEDLLGDLRNRSAKPTPEIITLLFKGIDWIKSALDSIRKQTYVEVDLREFLKDFVVAGAPAASAPAAASAAPAAPAASDNSKSLSEETKAKVIAAVKANNNIYSLVIKIEKKAVKILKAALVEERLKRSGDVLNAMPKLTEVPESTADSYIHVLWASPCKPEEVKGLLAVDEVAVLTVTKEDYSALAAAAPAAPAAQPVPVAAAAPAPAAAAPAPKPAAPAAAPAPAAAAPAAGGAKAPVEVTTMKVDARKLDNLMNLAGELVITRARFAQLVNEFNNEVAHVRESSSRLQLFNADLEAIKAFIRKSTRVAEVEKLSKVLARMENNLTLAQTAVSSKDIGGKVYSLDEATSVLGKLSSDIQSAVMQTRMVPIEGVFSRFKRLVRDISKELGKDINLELYGEDTELDKKIVDSLPDSLTHMIRNSIDHGIESKKDRIAAGKKETGTIQLKAVHQGNSICIEIIDDGKGLDASKISAKALEKGLITEEKLSKLTDKDKINFIFLPGFSTAEKVTGLSGRGVGMDVVKKMIEALGGTTDIETEVGKGSRFMLKIPLTLAIIQALLVIINGQVFAIPLESVSEIIKIGPKDVYSVDGSPMVKLRGHALSLFSMSNILGSEQADAKIDGERKVVVVTSNGLLTGIKVDRLIGEDEIVIKAFPDYFSNVNGISGASILGDGRIALILDVNAMMKEM